MVVKTKEARRVKCKRLSEVKLRGCFRREHYSARRPARNLPGGRCHLVVIGYILSRS